jgi:hypothetical protein
VAPVEIAKESLGIFPSWPCSLANALASNRLVPPHTRFYKEGPVSTISWYLNPAWYALGISVVALGVSVISYALTRRKARADVERGLIIQANEINNAFLRHGIRGPYAHYWRIPDDQVAAFTGKAVLLLNQLNLLRDVFHQRDILGPIAVGNYEKWAREILGPWIQADQDLCRVWARVKESDDIGGRAFVDWAAERLNLRDVSRSILGDGLNNSSKTLLDSTNQPAPTGLRPPAG